MDLERNAPKKEPRGTALLASRQRRADRVAAEQKEMQAALIRDGRVCRWHACEFKGRKLPIDPCHQNHRGSGGNPDGTRTTRATVISLCRAHHGLWDATEIDILPQTPDGFDGPVDFLVKNGETGVYEVFASEERRGVSVERGL
jgi:hypothetical protein